MKLVTSECKQICSSDRTSDEPLFYKLKLVSWLDLLFMVGAFWAVCTNLI